MEADEGLKELPTTFRFAKAKTERTDLTYQRYVDADLAKVEAEVPLEARYGETSRAWIWWWVCGGAAAVGFGVLGWLARPRGVKVEDRRFQVPESVTPFTVLGLLREIQVNNGLSDAKQQELAASIRHLERHYFAEPTREEPDLHAIATTWVNTSV
jgi:hypothetical protein